MKAGTGRCWKCHVARESWPPLPLPATADDIWPEFLRINLFAKLLLLFFITIIVVFTLDCSRDARRRQEGFCVWMHTWVPPSPCCQSVFSSESTLWVRRGLSVNTAGRHTKGTRSIPGGMGPAACLWLWGQGSPAWPALALAHHVCLEALGPPGSPEDRTFLLEA